MNMPSALEQVRPSLRMQVCTVLMHCPQPLPPSVKEILLAYTAKGDGDRDVLLAILQAKTAEDQVCLCRPYPPRGGSLT